MTTAVSDSFDVLLLPGWQGSGPGHWQTLWAGQDGFVMLQQDDWQWPRRGDWMARLDEVLAGAARPTILVAHSLGCHLVAAWAAHTRRATAVEGALLVAIPDTERDDMPPQLFNWRPIVRQRLPFPSIAVVSSDDPYASQERATAFGQGWGSRIVEIGPCGHINDASGLGAWPEGLALLQTLGRPEA